MFATTSMKGMFAMRPVLRSTLMLLAAITLPFCMLVGGGFVMARYSHEPEYRNPPPIERLSDHATGAAPLGRALAPGVQIWKGSAGETTRYFSDLEVVDDRVLLLSHDKLLVLTRAGAELRTIRGSGLTAKGSTISAGPAGGDVWIYASSTGHFWKYRVDGSRPDPRIGFLDRFGGTPYWVGSRIVKNGAFASELLRLYDAPAPLSEVHGRGPSPTTAPEIVQAQQAATIGAPLFPKLPRAFQRQLHRATLAVSPRRDKLAMAFLWHDRLHIYETAQLTLERAIAGPVESKLDFALVGEPNAQQRVTPSDETTYNYLDVTTTDTAIVALYSGRTDSAGEEASVGATLHVFTWDGRPAGVWELPDAVQAIALDGASRKLFALKRGDAHTLLVHDASDLLNGVAELLVDH